MLNQLHLDRWAEVLVDHATNIRTGSIVRINAQPSAERLLEAVYRKVLTAGGFPIVNCRPEFLGEAFYELANEQQLDWANPFTRFEAESIDASINIGASNNLRALDKFDPKITQRAARATQCPGAIRKTVCRQSPEKHREVFRDDSQH